VPPFLKGFIDYKKFLIIHIIVQLSGIKGPRVEGNRVQVFFDMSGQNYSYNMV